MVDLARDGPGSAVIEVREPVMLALQGSVAVGDSTFDIAVSRSDVYWTDSGAGAVRHAVGAALSTPDVFAATESDCRYITADARGAYWIRGDGHVRAKIAAANASAFDIATNQDSAVAIAADDLGVYWIAVDVGVGEIRRWDRASSAVTEVTRGFMPIVDSPVQAKRTLALNTLSMVWLTADGSVLLAPK